MIITSALLSSNCWKIVSCRAGPVSLGQEGVDKGFVGAAGGFDQAHIGLVDLFDRLVLR